MNSLVKVVDALTKIQNTHFLNKSHEIRKIRQRGRVQAVLNLIYSRHRTTELTLKVHRGSISIALLFL